MYQQPHLVPPMKLTLFDPMPSTPTQIPPSQLSQWVSNGKASLRSSLSIRRQPPSRPSISTPRPPLPEIQDLPFRRPQQTYRPLELSIYMAENRLSDLPEFDKLSFTNNGEIQLPAPAILRTKSEAFMHSRVSSLPEYTKPASMIEPRRMSRFRPDTSSTVISMSRPPSEYDALHSHPISWASLPGLPPAIHMTGRSEPSVDILSPMQEEFSPPATSVVVDGVALEFPQVESNRSLSCSDNVVSLRESQTGATSAPAKYPKNFSKLTPSQEGEAAPGYFHPNYQTQKRISQWLAHKGHSTSVSTLATIKTSSSSSSFSESRRKRAQFYQLSAVPPKALSLWPKQHQRTLTESTVASTAASDMLSFEAQSQTETTLTTPVDLYSRNGTVKNGSNGLRPILSGVPDVPPCYSDAIKQVDGANVLIQEIGGPSRSPGVGVAF